MHVLEPLVYVFGLFTESESQKRILDDLKKISGIFGRSDDIRLVFSPQTKLQTVTRNTAQKDCF